MPGSTPRPIPEPEDSVADLREYIPAIRHAVELARQEEREKRRRVEAEGFAVARRTRRELEELRTTIEAAGA